MNTDVEITLLTMFGNSLKYEGKSINSCSVLKHMYEESDVKLHSVSFFHIVSLFFPMHWVQRSISLVIPL
jgi:hypothetical protein